MFFSEHKIILKDNYNVESKFLFNFDENIYARAAAAAFDAAFDAAADAAFAAALAADLAAAFDAAFDALILLDIAADILLPPLRVRCLRDPLLRRDAILYILFIKKFFKIRIFLNNYNFLNIYNYSLFTKVVYFLFFSK
jgi:hypothetical protein